MKGEEAGFFKARRTLKGLLVFLVSFGLFIPGGLAAYVFGGNAAGLVVAGFGFVVIVIIVLTTVSPGSGYRFAEKGLVLKRERRVVEIPFGSIVGARQLNEETTEDIVREYLTPMMAAEASLSGRGWLKSSRRYGEFTRFCTVPIVERKTTRGHFRNIVRFGAKTSGGFLILRLASGAELLLSPLDLEGFYTRLSRSTELGVSIEPNYPPRSSPAELASPELGTERRMISPRLASFISITAIAAIYLAARVLTSSGSEPQAQVKQTVSRETDGESEIESGWLDENTYRVIARGMSLPAAFASDPETKNRLIRRTIDSAYVNDVSSGLLGEYLTEHDLEIDVDDYERVHAALSPYLDTLSAKLVSMSYDEETYLVGGIVDVTGAAFRETATSIIANAIGESP